MGPPTLRREVLPPRQSLRDLREVPLDEQARDAITRAIWTSMALTGIFSVLARLLGAHP